jgi:hypothetical protein
MSLAGRPSKRTSREWREMIHARPRFTAGIAPAAIHRRTVSSETPSVLAIWRTEHSDGRCCRDVASANRILHVPPI